MGKLILASGEVQTVTRPQPPQPRPIAEKPKPKDTPAPKPKPAAAPKPTTPTSSFDLSEWKGKGYTETKQNGNIILTAPIKEYAPSVRTHGTWNANENKYYRRSIEAGYTEKDFRKYGGPVSGISKYSPKIITIDHSGRISERNFQVIRHKAGSREKEYKVVEIKQGQEVIKVGSYGRQKVVSAKVATNMYASRDAKQSAAIRAQLVKEGKRDPYPTAYYVTEYKGKTYKHKDPGWKCSEYEKDLAVYNKAVGISSAKVISKSPGGIVEKEVTLTPRPGVSGRQPPQPKLQMKVPALPVHHESNIMLSPKDPVVVLGSGKSGKSPLKESKMVKLYMAETKAETFLGEKSGVSPLLKKTYESQFEAGGETVNSFSKALKEFSQGSKSVSDPITNKIDRRESNKVSNNIFTHISKAGGKVKKSFVLGGLGAKAGAHYLAWGLTGSAHAMSKYPARTAASIWAGGKVLGLIGKGTVATAHWAYPSMRLTTQAALAKGVPTALVVGGIGVHSLAQPTTHGKVRTALGDVGGLMAIYGARKTIGGAKTGFRLLTKKYYRMHELDPTRSYGFDTRKKIIEHQTPPRLKPSFESTLKKTKFVGKAPKDIVVKTYSSEDRFIKSFFKEKGAVLRGGRNFYSQLQGTHTTKGKDWDVGMFDNKKNAQELVRQLTSQFQGTTYRAHTKRLATTVQRKTKAGWHDVADIVPLKKAELKETFITGEGLRLENLKKATWRYYTTFYEPATTTGRSREKDLFKFMDALKHTQHSIKENPFYYEDVAWHAGESLPHIKKGTFQAKQMSPSTWETQTGQAGKKITFFGQDEFIHAFKKSGQDVIRLSGNDVSFIRKQQLPKQFQTPARSTQAAHKQIKDYMRWVEKHQLGSIVPSPQTVSGRTWKGAKTPNVEKEWIMMGDIKDLKYSGWGYDYWDKKPVRVITQTSLLGKQTPASVNMMGDTIKQTPASVSLFGKQTPYTHSLIIKPTQKSNVLSNLKTNIPKFAKDIASQKSISKDIAFSIKGTPDKSLTPLQKSYIGRTSSYSNSYLPVLALGRTSSPAARTAPGQLSRDIFGASSRRVSPNKYRTTQQMFLQPQRRTVQRPTPRPKYNPKDMFRESTRAPTKESQRDRTDPLRQIFRTVLPRDPLRPMMSTDTRRPPPQPRDPLRPVRPTDLRRPQPPGQSPPIILPFGASRPRTPRQQGFDVFVRVRGKFRKVSQSPMSKASAMSFGARKVHSSPAATFTLKKSGTVSRRRKKDPFYRQMQGRFRKKGSLFIEKSKHRISTAGEKAGITFKGMAASKKKRKKKNLWW